MAKKKELKLDARLAPDWLVASAARNIDSWRRDKRKIGGQAIFNIGKIVTNGTDFPVGEGMSVVSQLAIPTLDMMKKVEAAAKAKTDKDAKAIIFPPEQLTIFSN